jgi:hypothetical protein
MPSVKGKGNGGRRNEQAAENGKQVGRPLSSVTIRQDTPLMISQVYPDGMADLGRGKAQVRRVDGGGRMIVIPQADRSEIRILVF